MNTNVRHSIRVYLCSFVVPGPETSLQLADTQKTVQGYKHVAPLVLSPIELPREFARGVTAVETLKTAHRASLAELDALFATLQHRAFRGQL